MTIFETLVLYFIAALLLLALDYSWLRVEGDKAYNKMIKKLKGKKSPLKRMLIFYGVYVLGLLLIGLIPAVNEESLGIAMFRGGAFGFFTYAVHTLSNWATVDDWPKKVVIRDLLRGAFSGWVVATLTYNVYAAIYF